MTFSPITTLCKKIRLWQKKPSQEFFFVLTIIAISSLFRFYNFKNLFHFSLDEEFWSYLIQRVISYHDLILKYNNQTLKINL